MGPATLECGLDQSAFPRGTGVCMWVGLRSSLGLAVRGDWHPGSTWSRRAEAIPQPGPRGGVPLCSTWNGAREGCVRVWLCRRTVYLAGGGRRVMGGRSTWNSGVRRVTPVLDPNWSHWTGGHGNHRWDAAHEPVHIGSQRWGVPRGTLLRRGCQGSLQRGTPRQVEGLECGLAL